MVEPPTWPDSNVFINKLGIRDYRELLKAEADISTANAWFYLRDFPIPFQSNLSCLQQIHTFLFGDIYDWAGELRTYHMKKENSIFTPFHQIEHYANETFDQLAKENCLVGLSREVFIPRLAYYYSLINKIHPFPEGNGRAQRLFISTLAFECGYWIDWEMAHQWEIYEAAKSSFQGSLEATITLLDRITFDMEA